MIGVFQFTPQAGIAVRLGFLAATLEARGHTVRRIVCDGTMPRCAKDFSVMPSPGRLAACLECWPGMHRYLRLDAGAPETVVPLFRWVDADGLAEVERVLAGIDPEALADFRWQDLPLGDGLDGAMRQEYWGEAWCHLADWPAKARGWLLHMTAAAMATTRFITAHQPAALVVHNGLVPGEQAVMTVAARHGIRCISEEGGVRPGTLVLRQDHPAGQLNFAAEWAAWRDVPLTPAEADRIDQDLAVRQHQGHAEAHTYSPSPSGDLAAVGRKLGLQPGRPLLTAFAGTTGDTSIYEANAAFRSQADWLAACIAFAVHHPEVDLIIRAHPAEASQFALRYGRRVPTPEPMAAVLAGLAPVLPANVYLVPGDSAISSYDLLVLSRLVLVYVSTLGMEAAAGGWPVVAAGRSHYRDAGFVHPVLAAADFNGLVETLLAGPQPPAEAQTLAKRYLYLYAFRGMAELPLLRSQASPDDPATLAAFHAAAGTDQAVADRVAGYILGQRPWVSAPGDAGVLCPDWGVGSDGGAVGTLQDGPEVEPVTARFSKHAGETLVDGTGNPARLAEVRSRPTVGWLAVQWAGGRITWEPRWFSGPRDPRMGATGWEAEPTDEATLMSLQLQTTEISPPPGRAAVCRAGLRQSLVRTPEHADWHLAIAAMAVLPGDRIAGRHLIFAMEMAANLDRNIARSVYRRAGAIAKRLGAETIPPAEVQTGKVAGDQPPVWVLPSPFGPGLTVVVVVPPGQTVAASTLASIDGLASEIVIYDQGRQPDTRGIGGAHAAKLLLTPPGTPMSNIRSHALSQADGEWLCVLHNGEVLVDGDDPGLLPFLAGIPAGPATATVSRDGPGGGVTMVQRLYRCRDRQPGSGISSDVPQDHALPGIRIHLPPAGSV